MTVIAPDSPSWPAEADWRSPAYSFMQVDRSGIMFSGKLSLHNWELVGKRLLSLTDSASWWIADWLVYGESEFKDRYEEVIRRTSLNYQTLRNYTWVARKFELSRRRDNLSFGHHAEVAALEAPEQDFWLRKAEEFGWSRNQLRAEVRASRRERLNGSPAVGHGKAAVKEAPSLPAAHAEVESRHREQSTVENLCLHLTSDAFALCAAAAASNGLSVEEWAVQALGAAARHERDRLGISREPGSHNGSVASSHQPFDRLVDSVADMEVVDRA